MATHVWFYVCVIKDHLVNMSTPPFVEKLSYSFLYVLQFSWNIVLLKSLTNRTYFNVFGVEETKASLVYDWLYCVE